jgi:two-component system sensor histidine kinase/response regulator
MELMVDRTIHVLLVEDNPGDVHLIRRMLADASTAGPDSQPFDIICVDTLAGGVRSVHANQSDVVLLDLSLPDSQGLNTLARMQAAAPAVPVVVLTGLADESAALAAVQNGAQDYLVKGHVDPYALSNSIRYARERKQLLEALRKYSANLEERNAELDAFAHTVAHDLKNQVFTVAGNAELLLDKQAPPDADEQEEMLSDILRSAQKMSQVIQELLLLSQVRRVDVSSTEIDMVAVVAEAQARVWSLLVETGGELIVHDAEQWPPACGYAPWVEEVWYNYISNALKYGGQPPRVELGAERPDERRVCFWVRDNGPGLSADQMERLFVEFTRVSNVGQSGHGLGLSIVKRIIDKLGGEVGVQSQIGVGSVFRFFLPAAPCSKIES